MTPDGIRIEPLYRARDGAPTLDARPPPAADAERPWDLRTVIAHREPARASEAGARGAGERRRLAAAAHRSDRADGVAVGDRRRPGPRAGRRAARRRPGGAGRRLPRAQARPTGWRGWPRARRPRSSASTSTRSAPSPSAGVSPGPIEAHLIAAATAAARLAEPYPKASLFLASRPGGRTRPAAARRQELGFAAAARARLRQGAGPRRACRWPRPSSASCSGSRGRRRPISSASPSCAPRGAIWARLAGACGVDARGADRGALVAAGC